MMTSSGTTRADLQKLLACSYSRVVEILQGTAQVTPGDLALMADHMGFGDRPGYKEALVELRRNDNKRGFWTTGHLRAFKDDFRLMYMLEREADLLRCVGMEMIPDILQCEAYMRALFPDDEEAAPVEEYVAARMERQKILESGIEYHAVMSESCLASEYGGAAVMREQMAHLVKLSRRSNVTIQVVPFKAGASARKAVAFPFQLIRVPPVPRGLAGPTDMVYVEGPGEIRYIDDLAALAAYERQWRRATAGAQPVEQTVQFIEYVAARRFA